MNLPADDNLRRAAILIATLDTASADKLLEQMPATDAIAVRHLLMDLEDVAAEEQQEIFAQFLRLDPWAQPASHTDDASADVELCLSSTTEPTELLDLQSVSSPSESQPVVDCPSFAFLEAATCEQVIALLSAERPQTIALVISQLPEALALAVLSGLPKTLQDEVARRWLDLGTPDAEVLGEIAQEMRARLSMRGGQRSLEALQGGRGTMQDAESGLRRQLLSRLAESEATMLVPADPPLAFEDLEYLSDAGLSSLLAGVDQATLVLALAGATETFSERVARQLPTAAAKQLLRAINSLGPTRLADIELAQQRLAAGARKLLDESDSIASPLPSGPLG